MSIYAWGEPSGLILSAAGKSGGRYTVPPSQVRGYAEVLVRDDHAVWVTPDTLELTETGWVAWSAYTGRRRPDCQSCDGTGHGPIQRDGDTGQGYADDCSECSGAGIVGHQRPTDRIAR